MMVLMIMITIMTKLVMMSFNYFAQELKNFMERYQPHPVDILQATNNVDDNDGGGDSDDDEEDDDNDGDGDGDGDGDDYEQESDDGDDAIPGRAC